MKYRLTALTPLLVGDGRKLAPIDYMVWKDSISVLDQQRIFRLLSRGPRLDGYLNQLQRAEKLDFASWGGFAQNYAARRVAFEHPSLTPVWQAERAEHLHIPTFCAGPTGPYLPASALKGALRTGLAFSRWNEGVVKELAARTGDRPLRRPGEAAEAMTFGGGSRDPMRNISAGDSATIHPGSFRIYLLRVASLVQRNNRLELGWKLAGRGYVPGGRPEEATPTFAEMAPPRTVFTGDWNSKAFEKIFRAAADHAKALLESQRQYASAAGLRRLLGNLEPLGSVVSDTAGRKDACVVNLGWAGGFLTKTGFPDTANDEYRKLLRAMPFYERAIRSGLPFPKTRRIVFEKGEPANMPGWALLEIG